MPPRGVPHPGDPTQACGTPVAGWAPPPQQRAAQQQGEGLQLELWLTSVLQRWVLPAWGSTAPRGRLTLTSQMLMPPSIPVVQNCEQLPFPPASTEIWLRGAKRGWGVSPRSLPSPWGCLVAGGWEWGWTPSCPPPTCRDALGMPRDAQGLSQLLELDTSISSTCVQGCSGMLQGCSKGCWWPARP